ncbi:hypothetical protein HZH68_016435 [Vespula germanica]|uniref:Uncharacterized protein n=1 Tax=Vespula germanica TaxID=30212 RepID=A0A834MQ25_VESGE|nr:hypothetical protein HZH68_016435 [Vespula germanica]
MLFLQKIIFICYLLWLIVHASSEDDKPNKLYHKKYEVPRVKIKVFRGPTEEKNGETFAKWGFWIKQPRDSSVQTA